MKRVYPKLLCSVVTLIVLLQISVLSFGQITTGTYTVGADLANDYQTINEAIDSLESKGVSGHVTLSLVDAEYNERVGISEIPGTTVDNTVTIESATQNADDVRIWSGETNGSGINWVVEFNGCDYVTIQYVTIQNTTINSSYTRVISFWTESTNNKLLNNKIIGESGGPTGTNEWCIYLKNLPVNNTEISYNEISGGAGPCWFDNYDAGDVSTGVKFNYNTCTSNNGAIFEFCYGVEAIGNEIHAPRGEGIVFTECDQAIRVMDNIIHATSTSQHSGLHFNNCNGGTNVEGIIANNAIYVHPSDDNWGDANYGIEVLNSSHQWFFHNTVNNHGASLKSAAIYLNNNSALVLQNNIFVANNNGLAFYANNAANISTCNYNNFYTRGSHIAYYNGALYTDLANFTAATGFDDSKSKSVHPLFIASPDNLTPKTHWLDTSGVDLTGTIDFDINGVTRPTNPCLGAHEFTPTNPGAYSGALTIKPGGGGDFLSFQAAADSLHKKGISSSVIVSADDGIYNENLYLISIPGASATNTVTFTSASADSTKVTMEYATAAGDNYIVYLNNADYITLRHLHLKSTGSTHGILFYMNGNAHHNTIENCILTGAGTPAATSDRALIYNWDDRVDNLTIQKNVLNYGSRGIELRGIEDNFLDVRELIGNINITNNEFSDHEIEIYLARGTNFEIANNIFTNFTTSGIHLDICTSPYSVFNNKLSSTVSAGQAIYLDFCTGSATGGLIYNNFIHMSSTSDVFGIWLYRTNYQSLYHNSINLISSNNSTMGIRFDSYYNNTTEENNKLVNNIVFIDGPGFVLWNEYSNSFSQSDYNNFFTNGSTFAAVQGSNYSSLSSFASGTGTNANSINFNPSFISESDLHTTSYWINNKGTHIANVLDDIDGDIRHATTPDIGADEYLDEDATTTLAGTYTIGISGNYASFNDAIDDLILRGVTDHVIFNVQEGTYPEQVELPQISGSGVNATIIFQSDPANTNQPILTYVASNANDNYVIKLDGADYVTIKGLNIITGTTRYAQLIVLNGNTDNITIIDNKLSGRSTATRESDDCPIYSNASIFNNVTIRNNEIENGSYGIWLRAQDANRASNVLIKGNTINSFYHGIYMQYIEAPVIDSNYIRYTFEYNDYANGMQLDNCNNSTTAGMEITNNQIYSTVRTSGGIYLNNCSETGTYTGLIANNVISVGATAKERSLGIYLYYSDYKNVLHNSVNLIGNHLSDIVFVVAYSNFVVAKNNIFACKGDVGNDDRGLGYALHCNNSTNFMSDYNNYYTSGRYFAQWLGEPIGSIEAYQSTSSLDANSMNVFPAFFDVADLHTQSSFMNGAATVLAEVTTDINGVTRDVSSPDLGAYEYSNVLEPLSNGTYTVGFGADIPTFDSLMNALYARGISGHTEINILTGTYSSTSLIFHRIPGVSSSDTLLIQSQSGKASDVKISYAQSSNFNAIVLFNGCEYLTLKNMSFLTAGTNYANVFSFNGYSKHINIIGNELVGMSSATSENAARSCIYVQNNNIVDDILISENTFSNNSYGIYYNGWNFNTSNIEILNNTFSGQYRGIYAYRTKGLKIYGNKVSQFGNTGIRMYECDNDIIVTNNILSTTSQNLTGIVIDHCDGNPGGYGLIANNFVRAFNANSYGTYGINVNVSTYQKVYHNTVSVSGTNTGSRTLNCWDGENNVIMNNIFIADAGYAYVRSGVSPIQVSDNNALYTSGIYIALNYQTKYTTFAEFQAATFNTDANSVNIKPEFVSETDLHLADLQLMEKGSSIPVGDIPIDIDGELRDVTDPDIGADEIYARPPVAESFIICEGDTTPTLSATGSNINWYGNEELTQLLFSASEYTPTVIAPGTYTYYVTETIAADESEATVVTLTINAIPEIASVVTNIDCSGNDQGSINLTITGDSETYFYDWSNGLTDEDITQLTAGDYSVVVEDLNGCQVTGDFTVSALAVPDLAIITNDADCEENNGGMTVTATGGVAPYEYIWTTGDTTTVVDSLYSGIYVVTVTGANGCIETAIATINDLGGATITEDAVQDVTCYGDNNGAISLTITGGAQPYDILWTNGDKTEDVSNLYAGPYEIAVTAADGCKSIKSIVIEEPEPLFIDVDAFESNCNSFNGHASVNVSGGTQGYSYAWSNGSSADEITSLGLGVYRITVTDANTCTSIKSFTISEIGAPSVKVDSIVQGTCGGANGGIYITPYGGVGSTYTFDWSNFTSDEDLTGVNPGEYSVTVTDSIGCSGAKVETIPADKPETPAICIVSVDTLTNNNEVIWEKPITTDISQFKVYRESSQSGVYLEAGSVNYADESLFVDENSNALQRSYRYKLQAVDVCGVPSDLSDHHKTMHLTVNKGLDGDVNLIWDHYEGFEISTYYIYRHTNASGWVKYDSISSNLTSYTDANALEENLAYFIEIVHPFGCTSTKATNKNSSRSNIRNISNQGSLSILAEVVSFTLVDQAGEAVIDTEGASINISVITGTDVSALIPTIEISDKATISPESGVSQDFTNPVVYTVTAESGLTKDWTVTVKEQIEGFYDVTFIVTDAGSPVGGAEVTFNSVGEFTNSSGTVVFADQSPANDILYTVVKSGYNTYSATLNVVDANVTENVSLVPVGLELTIQNSLVIYPNPNTGKFYLKFTDSRVSDIEIRIFNTKGIIVSQNIIENKSHEVVELIDINAKASGVYYMQIISGDYSTYQKIIKQ